MLNGINNKINKMQTVGIQLSSALSALDYGISQLEIASVASNKQQHLENLLCSDTQTLLSSDILSPSVCVGAYPYPLLDIVDQDLKGYQNLKAFQSRNLAFALTALQPIEAQLKQMTQGIPAHRLAIVFGTSTSGIADNQLALEQHQQSSGNDKTPYLHHQKQAMASLAVAIQRYLGWQGIAYSISTACSSSAKAFATAQRLLNSDQADIVLVGGVDTLCGLTLHGFNSLESLSSSICTPCGAHRDGINIGEAAALFVLSRDHAPVNLFASGESMDAWHISAPHPEGKGAERAMREALKQANLSAQEIDYLNMHGTATPQNDAMETRAIHTIFGEDLPVSSTKHKTGHCLGAAGAIEAYICQQVLSSEDTWLPWHHDGEMDINLNALNYVRPQSTFKKANIVMSNSFAFGGSNISLIFSRGSHA